MKIQIENVKKEDRRYVIDNLLKAIDGKGSVYFTLDKAIIEIKMPFIITEETLIEKSKHKKAINNFITEFRHYQFNKEVVK